MSKISRRVFLAAGSAMAAVAASGVTYRATAQTGAINLYSSRHYDTDQELYDSFMRKTGLKVNLIEAEADPLIERLKSEGANSPADVFLTADVGRLWRAKQDGLLAPTNSATLQSAIPAALRDPENFWFGFSSRIRVIMYSKDRVNPADLSTYEALTDAKWRGKILTRSSTNVYNQSWTASVIAVHGAADTEAWAKGLVANFARPPEGGDTPQIKAVAAGVGDLAIANTYYLARLAKSSDPAEKAVAEKVGVFFPNQRDRGAHINVSGGGIVKTSKNPAAAALFLEHLASPEAQAIFASGNNEYPVLKGTPLDPILQSYGEFKYDPVNLSRVGELGAEATRIMDRAGWK
ncbi:MAG: Fe(3+) ABC transporter substrate-binding protein [Drouetiella hepatica Uher 2000/2452]|jgi:iron(III) transport system substrate-binding protein|uniref:Fe(3+) ABC transporter substrate-binding protein n=1 Tax=Drouetiella hepatica Uher 2000/2452 TaxID=904376 RepID=A0A951QAN1_9CYAN|nr:Fe(3+) ABC transporter substrate-binding protein [Drouetiella hepatica Uher 2000/2452]